MRYLIECSYKGIAFHGWQIQPNAMTVQEQIEKALSIILKQKIMQQVQKFSFKQDMNVVTQNLH